MGMQGCGSGAEALGSCTSCCAALSATVDGRSCRDRGWRVPLCTVGRGPQSIAVPHRSPRCLFQQHLMTTMPDEESNRKSPREAAIQAVTLSFRLALTLT